MSDNGEADTEEPAVPLGEGATVEGAPTARVASRLYFPIEASEVRRREGETTIRTPGGPRDVDDVLAESDEVYFPDRQSFVDAVEDVVGTGPIPTEGDGGPSAGDGSADAAETPDSESAEPDNAAEAPQDEEAAQPDQDNAAEAAEDEGGDGPAAAGHDDGDGAADQDADAGDEAASDEAPGDEDEDGGFEFDDPEE